MTSTTAVITAVSANARVRLVAYGRPRLGEGLMVFHVLRVGRLCLSLRPAASSFSVVKRTGMPRAP